MDNYEAFEALCELLSVDRRAAPDASLLEVVNKIEWEQVIPLADRYIVLPSLYLSLKHLECLQELPEEVRELLTAVYQVNEERNHQLIASALSVARTLNAVGIQPLLLKGITGLVTNLYSDTGERVMTDIDMMVGQTDLQSAVTALTKAGYQCVDEVAFEQVQKNQFVRRELTLAQPEYGFGIDLHISPFGTSGKAAILTFEDASQRAQNHTVDGAHMKIPPIEFRILHNYYHAQHADLGALKGTINLRQLQDWKKLSEQCAEEHDCYERVLKRIRSCRKSRAFAIYQYLCAKYLKAHSPGDAQFNSVDRALVWRQKAIIRNIGISRVNRIIVYILEGLISFTPERLRLCHGDLPIHRLALIKVITIFSPRWYLRRVIDFTSG